MKKLETLGRGKGLTGREGKKSGAGKISDSKMTKCQSGEGEFFSKTQAIVKGSRGLK